jgi:hypothetical protein
VRLRSSPSSATARSSWSAEAGRQIDAAIAAGEEPQGAYQWVTLYDVAGEDAVPRPADWFDGPRDERYGVLSDGGYGKLSPATSS